ncbi:hypothetical protein GYN07_29100 (plasmid) [Rhizobium leguminosarum bv. viciae 248]|nr:hypothetical protein [Rhizobium leguminosarum bv. viciae]QHW28725.1 hypothetical protein GYN07_29100 [Rhizobium leguminosarum bv. viciae 248]
MEPASCNGSSSPILARRCQTVRCGTDRRGAGAVLRLPAASIRTGAITPLLGGVGPMAIASLMHNTLIAASMRGGLGVPLLRQM